MQSPMDLSEETTTAVDLDKRNHKPHDVRRILCLPSPMPIEIPEQTEPEDLSMHSPRSSLSHDDDLDDLDDAATLYMKHRQYLQNLAK